MESLFHCLGAQGRLCPLKKAGVGDNLPTRSNPAIHSTNESRIQSVHLSRLGLEEAAERTLDYAPITSESRAYLSMDRIFSRIKKVKVMLRLVPQLSLSGYA